MHPLRPLHSWQRSDSRSKCIHPALKPGLRNRSQEAGDGSLFWNLALTLIIDCHGHYTTVPEEMQAFRNAQLAHTKDPQKPAAVLPHFSDDQLRETLEGAQLRLLRERGIDVT